MPGNSRKHFGKYRGTVMNNQDPMRLGRVQLSVPDVPGFDSTAWAVPCAPVAGLQSGVFVVPSIGANVWVEFERGDSDFPIWVGGFWGDAAAVPTGGPDPGPAGSRIVIQSQSKHSITISDVDDVSGGIVLQSADGALVRIASDGILLSNGKGATVRLVGPTVDINFGALTVT